MFPDAILHLVYESPSIWLHVNGRIQCSDATLYFREKTIQFTYINSGILQSRHREEAEVGEISRLAREKIREWQIRRLEVKDQMQLHPEKTLELSRVLDLMDEEHAEILSGSKELYVEDASQQEVISAETAAPVSLSRPTTGKFELQLDLTARSRDGLRKLLEMAVHELKCCIDARDGELTCEQTNYSGMMSGTLGGYEFELVLREDSDE